MSTAHGRRGLKGRVNSPPAPELVAAGYALEVEGASVLHRRLALSHVAHVLELKNAGALGEEEYSALCSVLSRLDALDPSELPYGSEAGDAFDVQESWVLEEIGSGAGWLTAGRARREALRVAYRLLLRERVLDAYESTVQLLDALLQRSSELAGVVVPDYTYLQRAQTTSFGHYLLSFAPAQGRHLDRFREAYARLNRSPAGVGPISGSRFPFDRHRLARRLGFDGPIAHDRDAMWQTDPLVDSATAGALALTSSAQLAQDLEILASSEFGFVVLPGSVCRPSAVMPQKRNPYGLAVVRGLAGRTCGQLSGILSMQRTGSARADNALFSFADTSRCLDWTARGQALMAVAVAGLQVDASQTASAAEDLELRATDMAEYLAMETELDYASAYRVIARAFALGDESGAGLADFPRLVALAMEEELGHEQVVDLGPLLGKPFDLLQAREGVGSATEGSIQAMLESAQEDLRGQREWLTVRRKAQWEAEDALWENARSAAGS